MSRRRKTEQPKVVEGLPFFQNRNDDGGRQAVRLEVYRLQPEGTPCIGEAPLNATQLELQQWARENDYTYGRRGGLYNAQLKDQDGQIVTQGRFRVDPDPNYKAPPVTAAGDAGGPLAQVVTILQATTNSYLDRVRAEARDREAQHKLEMERQRAEADERRERDRSYWEQQRERDREAASEDRRRQNFMWANLFRFRERTEQKPFEQLAFGLKLGRMMENGRDELREDEDTGFLAKLGDRLLRKLDGKPMTHDDEDDTIDVDVDEPETKREKAAPAATPPAAAAPASLSPVERLKITLDTLVAVGSHKVLVGFMMALLKRKQVDVGMLRQLIAGEMDKELGGEKAALDKLKRAAEDVLRYVARPRPVPEPERAPRKAPKRATTSTSRSSSRSRRAG
ncbi:MAG: hypothetical protein ACRENJ_00300 [Candidatus Eiseniibacteriota bacterium]